MSARNSKGVSREIRVEPSTYPNGDTFLRVSIGREVIGRLDLKDGGYVPFGCRKVNTDLEAAVRDVVWRRVQSALKEAAAFSTIFNEYPVNVDAVDPHDGTTLD